jgi:hypothetical protein
MTCRKVAEYNGRAGKQRLVGQTPSGPVFAPFRTEADCLNACKEGACCEGTTCTVKPQCQCQGAGKTFKGVGTTCITSDILCCKAGAAGTRTGTELCEPLNSACGCAAGSYQAASSGVCTATTCRKCKCTTQRNFPVSIGVTCRALFRGATWNDSCGKPYLIDPSVVYAIRATDARLSLTLYLIRISTMPGTGCNTAEYRSTNAASGGFAENSVYLYLTIEDFLAGSIGRCKVSGRFIYEVNALRYDGSDTRAYQSYGTPFGWNGILGDDNLWDGLDGMVVPCGYSGLIGPCWTPNVPTDESTITITSANYLP